jgi:electron transfer flavoprotein alpha/beta subunit
MKILVPVKRVVDFNVKVRVKSDGSGVDTANVKMNIMKAKKKPMETVKPEDLGVNVAPRIQTLKVAEPAGRKAGIKVADVALLVDKLRNEAKVI